MEDKITQNKDQENTVDTADFSINADENAAGTTHLNDPVEEDETVTQYKTELQEQKDKYLRLMAEFENYKRRTAKERMELIQTAGKDIIVSLLDVMDDMDRAEKQLKNSNDIEQIRNKSEPIEYTTLKAIIRNQP